MTLWAHGRSALSLAFITVNLLFWLVALIPLALLRLLWSSSAGAIDPAMAWIYRTAVAADDLWLERVLGLRWDRPALPLSRDRSYIVLANHATWSDILLIQSVIARDGPLLKFLVKRELLAVPIVGLIIWAYGFPVLQRRARVAGDEAERRRADLETLRAACRVVRERPAALVNFAEGTRFREEKRVETASPYRHLLRPRSGGLSALLEGLDDEIEGLVDLTLVYPRPVSFWEFLSGQLPWVGVEAELIPRKALPESRDEVRAWLEERWRRKDERIAARRAREARQAGTPEARQAGTPEAR